MYTFIWVQCFLLTCFFLNYFILFDMFFAHTSIIVCIILLRLILCCFFFNQTNVRSSGWPSKNLAVQQVSTVTKRENFKYRRIKESKFKP